MTYCKKCGSEIPAKICQDGKTITVSPGRKSCFRCVPSRHKQYGFSADGRIHANKRAYTPASKECITLSLYRRGLERKEILLNKSGGKCQNCGYTKCKKALSFHHRIASEKKFGLSINNLWSKSWDLILIEHNKCDLLCLNCHAETEDQITKEINGCILTRVNAKYGTNFQ